MSLSIFSRVLLFGAVLGLSACGGSDGGGTADREVSVSGMVVNGPLSGAEVSVRDASGALLGSGATTVDGSFSITITNPEPPLRLISRGGTLDGNPYVGTLQADCTLASDAVALTCNLTPYSTLASLFVDGGLTQAEAAAQLFDVFRMSEDPFVQDANNPDSVPLYKFDLDSARTTIGDGSGLAGWLTLMQDWVEVVVAWIDAGNNDAPIVGTPPPGTPVYRIELQQLTTGGVTAPAFIDVPMGGQAQFTVTPDANHDVVISGCGGALEGNTYTTGTIASAGGVSGVCKVKASFPLTQLQLVYVAGQGGTIEGNPLQSITYGDSGSEVEAVPNNGYEFVDWSDGIDTPKRIDTNVVEGFTVTANFTIKSYMLRYAAGNNGSLVVGETTYEDFFQQSVLFQGSGQSVTAVPEPGYEFTGWDDAVAANPRTDSNVAADLDVEALFAAKEGAIPWSSSLHGGDIRIEVAGPEVARLDWAADPEVVYDLYISPVADMVLDQYASVPGGMLAINVTPPFTLTSLIPDTPVYVAIRADNELFAWSSFVPRSWGVDGQVLSQSFDVSGNRYIGGDFGQVALNLRAATVLAAADDSASGHPLVFPDVDGVVHSMLSDGQGGWYIGGKFSRVGGEPRQNLARVDAAGQVADWSGFVSGGNAVVYKLLSVGGAVVVAGDFSDAGGPDGSGARSNLAIFLEDGNLFEGFSLAVNGPVRDVFLTPQAMWVAGDFSAAGGMARAGVAKISVAPASFGAVLPWDGKVGGVVNAILVESDRVVVAGSFEEVLVDDGQAPRSLLAAFDLNGTLLDFAPVITGPVDKEIHSLALRGDDLLVGGRFDAVDGQPRSGLATFANDNSLQPQAVSVDGVVHALGIAGSLLYVGGEFDMATGVNQAEASRMSLAAFDEGGNLLEWRPRLVGAVADITMANGVVAVAGDFSGVAAQTARNNLAAFAPDGELLPWAPATDAPVYALHVSGDTVYLGGVFSQLGNPTADTERLSLGAVDRLSGAVTGWNPSTDGEVRALVEDGGVIYFAGSFSAAGELPRKSLAAADTTGLMQSWNPVSNGSVAALLMESGVIYAGGSFSAAGRGTVDTGRLNLAAFDSVGELLAWNPGADGKVASLTSLNGDIYVGGAFLNAGNGMADTPRAYLAAFDSAGNLLDWNPETNAAVTSLSADTAIYAAGEFTEVGAALARQGVAAFDAAGLVLDWNPGAVTGVRSVLAANGLIAVAGAFDRVGSAEDASDDPRAGLAVFDDAGALLPR